MSDEKKPKNWLLIYFFGLFYLLVFTALLYNSFNYLDPDFGWHLKTGEQIWQTHAVPSLNNENWTLAGTTWVDHEWLANLLTYFIYHNLGYVAVSVFFALLITAALIIQLLWARKNFLTNDRGLLLFLGLQGLGVYCCLPSFGVRMQEISVLNLLLLLIIINQYEKNKNYRVLFWLPVLFIFWASLHGGFLIGLFVLGLYAAVKALEFFLSSRGWVKFLNYQSAIRPRQIATFLIFAALALAITFLTPYHARLYEFLSGYRDNFYQSHLSEWLGQYIFPFVYRQLVYLEIVILFFVLVFFGAFIFQGRDFKKINLWSVALLAVFSALAFKARRHFPLLFIVSAPILAAFFADFLNLPPFSWEKLRTRARWLNIFLVIFISAALLFSVAAFYFSTSFTNHPETAYASDYPYQAVQFLRAHPEWLAKKMFNEYGWGGYLIWQDPAQKLFCDGRLPQYPLHGHSLLEEYYEFSDPVKIPAKLKQYDIGLALVKIKKDKIRIHWWEEKLMGIKRADLEKNQQSGFALADYLRGSSGWQSVYRDNLAEIFIKK
ncbi:MAG TPA: hypothetical protein VMD74_01420 [Candidatus Methylomirabilis sp.]|nr:hypothetical protein [Candidatus Methylomirabilis sp.]